MITVVLAAGASCKTGTCTVMHERRDDAHADVHASAARTSTCNRRFANGARARARAQVPEIDPSVWVTAATSSRQGIDAGLAKKLVHRARDTQPASPGAGSVSWRHPDDIVGSASRWQSPRHEISRGCHPF